jgi:hypothetical protein
MFAWIINNVMTIPWDDDSDRPDWLPYPGEPIDAATAALLAARYLPDVRALLTEIEAVIATKHAGQRWVRPWTVELILKHWDVKLPMVLLGLVTIDQRMTGGSFHAVNVHLDKESGELSVRDHHGLLRG